MLKKSIRRGDLTHMLNILTQGFRGLRDEKFVNVPNIFENKQLAEFFEEYNTTVNYLLAQSKDHHKMSELLTESQRMAQLASHSKSRFLANMSHEIRTPINGIIGLARMIQDGNLTETQRTQVNMLLDSASYLQGLINDILDLTKIEEGKMRMEIALFSVGEVIEMVMNTVQYSAQKKHITLNIENQFTDDRFLLGDPLRLRQVLINLLTNAIKFTPEHGTISLIIEATELTSDDALIKVQVKDSGIGMDSATRDRLFKPFEQADASTTRKFGGTGLGLSICKKLVEMMGGQIGVESQLSKGSTFWFSARFNLGPSMENLIPEVQTPDWMKEDIEEKTAPIKVLMAEDHLVNQIVMKALLEKYNLEVQIANNGLEAIEAAKTGLFRLIFMDCQMPEMDGYEATKHIRSLPDTRISMLPIIALTANAMSGDREHCLEVGMNGFIAKPVEIRELETQLRLWLRGA